MKDEKSDMEIIGSVAPPLFQMASTVAVTGFRKLLRYFSPTILVAGQNSAGKTTLQEYFSTGYLPPKPRPMDETARFNNEMIDLSYKGETKAEKSFSFWIRDSRGFFDSGPLVQDIADRHPRFIFIIFDIRRILDPPELTDEKHINTAPMKYFDAYSWLAKFSARVDEYMKVNSKAKRKISGGAAIINKCDLMTESDFKAKAEIVKKHIKPLFVDLQPRLGFGEMNFDIFYTSMIRNATIPRPTNEVSDLPEAISFMIRCLTKKKVI